jgi:3-phenylpropionate/trans-cinnamate dioxygenase ferredoxin reductase component
LEPLVIVGASLAGLRAAEAARRGGWDSELVVVGEEGHMPYTRPPLSKELLTKEAASLTDHLLPAQVEATWMLGERATGIDRHGRRLELAGGERLAYERLVIATGCRARQWSGPGAELSGLHVIRHAEDALELRAALTRGPRLAIVGAGFIGCEVASSARALDLEVSLFDIASTPMPALGPLLGERCASLHRSNGVSLHLGLGIAALYGEHGRVRGVELADGTRHEADLVVVALGAVPCTDWLADSGLDVERGVRCDATLTVDGDPDLLAAGDIAEWPHPLAGGERIRIEHWTNAAEQGSFAGRNAVVAAAERQPYTGIPSFWSDQYGIRIQALGLPHLGHQHHVVEESPDGVRLVAVAERDGKLVGVVAFEGARRLPFYRTQIGGPLDLGSLRTQLAEDPKAFGTSAVAA